MRGKGKLIPYERLLLGRAVRSQKETIEGVVRLAAASGEAAKQLTSACAALQKVARECAKAGERFEQTRRFRAECEAAAQLGSVEDMIRRRDELLARHRRSRRSR